MGQNGSAENSARVRERIVSFSQLLVDAKAANANLCPFFSHPRTKQTLSFSVYTRIPQELLHTFWRFRNNVLVVCSVNPPTEDAKRKAGKKVRNPFQNGRLAGRKRFALTIREFYFMVTVMEDNLMTLSKILQRTGKPSASIDTIAGAASAAPVLRFQDRKRNGYNLVQLVRPQPPPAGGKLNATPSSVAAPSTPAPRGPPQTQGPTPTPGPADAKQGIHTSGLVSAAAPPLGKPPSSHRIDSSDLCSICLDEPSDVVLDCLHAFCHECIDQWNVKSHTCPICRREIDNKGSEANWVLTHSADADLFTMAEENVGFIFDYICKRPVFK